jgi:hypothetical protein
MTRSVPEAIAASRPSFIGNSTAGAGRKHRNLADDMLAIAGEKTSPKNSLSRNLILIQL